MVPPRPGGLFGGAGETSNTAPGLAFSQGAGRDAQAFADVVTEFEQGLKGGRVGAVGERIQQGAGFGRDVGWFSNSCGQTDRAYAVRVVEASRPGRLGPMPRRSSGCRLVLGRVESAEADLELVVAQRWLQHRGDELLA